MESISRLEDPSYGKATLTTLKKIASAYDVGLLVEFVPFSQLVNRVSGTPYIERGFSPETMNVPSFDEEEKQGALEPKDDTLSLLEQIAQLGLASGLNNFIWPIGTAKEESFQPPTDRQKRKHPLPFPLWGSASKSDSQNKMSMGGQR